MKILKILRASRLVFRVRPAEPWGDTEWWEGGASKPRQEEPHSRMETGSSSQGPQALAGAAECPGAASPHPDLREARRKLPGMNEYSVRL